MHWKSAHILSKHKIVYVTLFYVNIFLTVIRDAAQFTRLNKQLTDPTRKQQR